VQAKNSTATYTTDWRLDYAYTVGKFGFWSLFALNYAACGLKSLNLVVNPDDKWCTWEFPFPWLAVNRVWGVATGFNPAGYTAGSRNSNSSLDRQPPWRQTYGLWMPEVELLHCWVAGSLNTRVLGSFCREKSIIIGTASQYNTSMWHTDWQTAQPAQ